MISEDVITVNTKGQTKVPSLCSKVHDPAQSFVLLLRTGMNYVTNTLLLASSSARSKQLLCFVQAKGQKANKNIQQRTLSGFKTIPLY